MHIEVHHIFSWSTEPPPWATELRRLIINRLDHIMLDITKLQSVVARLQASDTAALAALQALKDQNTAMAAKLAALPPVDDPTTQKAIDDVVASLTDTADKVDAAVTANPATPNLT